MTGSPIPPANPHAGYLARRRDIDEAVLKVLSGGSYILGEQGAAFEREFASYIGVGHAIGVANGTDALFLALKACGAGPGDEVVTVSHTAVATVAAIEMTGATAVLVDVKPDTLTIDPDQVRLALTPRTKVVIPVHLYGYTADLAPLRELTRPRGIRILEDCAQSHGARYQGIRTGSFGDLAAFSFYPTKNLGALGDGGAVVTNDPALADRLRLLRQYGWRQRYISEIAGVNSRLDEVQAAILRVQLRHLDSGNAKRRALAAIYDAALASTSLALPSSGADREHVYHQYVVRLDRRDDLQARLKSEGIGTLIHYPMPVHLQPAYAGRIRCVGSLPHSCQAATSVLSLPLFPELSPEDAGRVATAILAWDKSVARA